MLDTLHLTENGLKRFRFSPFAFVFDGPWHVVVGKLIRKQKLDWSWENEAVELSWRRKDFPVERPHTTEGKETMLKMTMMGII